VFATLDMDCAFEEVSCQKLFCTVLPSIATKPEETMVKIIEHSLTWFLNSPLLPLEKLTTVF
jgi:hypothetical protein